MTVRAFAAPTSALPRWLRLTLTGCLSVAALANLPSQPWLVLYGASSSSVAGALTSFYMRLAHTVCKPLGARLQKILNYFWPPPLTCAVQIESFDFWTQFLLD